MNVAGYICFGATRLEKYRPSEYLAYVPSVTIKDILNEAQHTSLAIVLGLLEGDLRRAEAWLTLTQFEDQVLMPRKALSEAILDGVMAGQETRQLAKPVKCPTCGQPTENKGLQMRQVETRVGALRLRRQSHCCAHCQAGFFLG